MRLCCATRALRMKFGGIAGVGRVSRKNSQRRIVITWGVVCCPVYVPPKLGIGFMAAVAILSAATGLTSVTAGYDAQYGAGDGTAYLQEAILPRQAYAQSGQAVPTWVQNVFVLYAEERIQESELLNAIQYLIEIDVIAIAADPSEIKNTGSERIQDLGDFNLTYEPASPFSNYGGTLDWLNDTRLLDDETEFLNENFRLPYDVGIVARECREANAFYDPATRQIVMCYELMNDMLENWNPFNAGNPDAAADAGAGEYVYYVAYYVLWDQVGHAIIDIYDLPITGLEDNVADQFSALVLSYTYDPQDADSRLGQDMPYHVRDLYAAMGGSGDSPYWAAHGLDMQRYHNISCYAYGSDPDRGRALVDDGLLPEERAVLCEDEYDKVKSTWGRLLGDFTNGFLG